MNHNLDSRLRQLAAQDQPTPADADRIWDRVQELSTAAPPRPRRVPARPVFWAVAASACLLLLAGGLWQDVGTDNFDVADGVPGFMGGTEFKGRLREVTSSNPEARRGDMEELLARLEAGEYRLEKVAGYTFRGRTLLTGIATVMLTTGPRTSNIPRLETPINAKDLDTSLLHMRFLREKLGETKAAARAGRGKALADTTIIANGIPFRCQRRSFTYPEFGTVIWWDGPRVDTAR